MAEDQRKESGQNQKQDVTSTEYLVHNWLEALFAWFQVIVFWHEPFVSFCTISSVLSSFLLLTYFAPRFYATIMIAAFIYNLNKFWFRHVWPEIRVPPGRDRELEMRLDVDRFTLLHPHLMTLAELKGHFRNLMKISEHHLHKLLLLRQNRPAAFCSLVCSVLTCTAYIGNRISGMSMIFLILTTISSAPGIYVHMLSIEDKNRLHNFIRSLLLSNCDDYKTNVELAEQQAGEIGRSMKKGTIKHKSLLESFKFEIMQRLETFFDNFKRQSPVSMRTQSIIASGLSATSQGELPPQASSKLSPLKDDGAKVFYNLIDVTLMGGKQTDSVVVSSTTTDENLDLLKGQRMRSSSECSESGQLIESDDEQQDDGFVMLG